METKVIRTILVLSGMLLFLVGLSSAGYKKCYDCCYTKCRASGYTKIYCKYSCSIECGTTIPTPPCPSLPPPHVKSNCGFTCAESSCGHLDPEDKDMGVCVDNCVKKCAG